MNKFVGTLVFIDEVGEVPANKTWISFLNKGSAEATLKSFNDKGVVKGTIPLITIFDVGQDRSRDEWGKFEVDATGTEVHVAFLD